MEKTAHQLHVEREYKKLLEDPDVHPHLYMKYSKDTLYNKLAEEIRRKQPSMLSIEFGTLPTRRHSKD